MNTIRRFQGFGCSFKGFQTFLHRRGMMGNVDGLDDWDVTSYQSDADWCQDACDNGFIHINQLPHELLVEIFSYMSARTLCSCVLPVCRLWYRLGNDPVLWTWLDFSYRNEQTHMTMVKTVSLRFQFLSSLTLKNFRSAYEMHRMLLHMGNNCSRMREVQLFNCALKADTLVKLGEMCPNITSLSLICCDENYRKLHYMWSYMRDCSFVSAFPALTSLCLFRTLALATLSFEDAQTIVNTCRNLKRLALDCDFYGRAIRHIIASLAPTLEVLWLQGRNYNDSMCREISKCGRLRELGLSHVENITPFGLKFLGSLKRLEKLLLFHANNISSKSFRDFFAQAKLTRLSYVNLSGCKGIDVSVEAAVRKACPRVREIIVDRRVIRREAAYVDFGLYDKQEMFHRMHFVSVQPLNCVN